MFLPIPAEMKAALDLVPLPPGCDGESKHFFWNGVSSECSMKSVVERCPRSAFRKSGVARAHAHRFRHTLATELLGQGASFEDVADVLGNSPEIRAGHSWARLGTKRILGWNRLKKRLLSWCPEGDLNPHGG
ncbi:MAG TPA: hypothetical protein VJV22_02800 [Acidobacteriaceae bacterium]|nr:hypothetical protein [Acidobacteriaceae bacterium]